MCQAHSTARLMPQSSNMIRMGLSYQHSERHRRGNQRGTTSCSCRQTGYLQWEVQEKLLRSVGIVVMQERDEAQLL
jgi:hypothetical protein